MKGVALLGSIFLSRYRVESKLRECSLYRAFELRDVLGGRRALLFLYPAKGRAALDLTGFRYRQARLAELCGSRIPACRMGEEGGDFHVILDLDETASPLALPLADAALQELLSTVFRDLALCRTAGLRLYQLSPDLIWRDGRGQPFYLPPLYLHFPGFLDHEDPDLDPAPELQAGREFLLDADLHGFGRLVERFTVGKPDWSAFRDGQLDRLLQAAPGTRPDPATLLAASPLAGDDELEGIVALDRQRPPAPSPTLAESMDALLRDHGNGENLWIELQGPHAGRSLRGLDLHLRRAGGLFAESGHRGWSNQAEPQSEREALLLFRDLQRPEELLDPIWQGEVGSDEDRRLFALAAADGLAPHPELHRRVDELLSEWPRLRRVALPLAETPSPEPAESWAAIDEDSKQLLEILALQDAPLGLGLLGRLFPREESALFARLAALETGAVLRWRPGRDLATACWGLRVEIDDPTLQRWIRKGLNPERRRELHRLCADLFTAESGDLAALQRLYHLAGAEEWPGLAGEGYRLFQEAERGRNNLLQEQLAGLLRRAEVEPHLKLEGKHAIHLYLGRGILHRGDLDGATDMFGEGLRSLTGNAVFIDELLDERRQRPTVEGLGDPKLLPAVSAFIRELAEIGETRGEFTGASRMLGRLLDAFSEELSAYERGLLLNEQAWLNYRMGEHERAVERCEVALRLFDGTAHRAELGQTYNTLGAAQWALNRWSEAEAYYKRALALRERTGDQNRVAASLNNLGNLYRLTERFPLAIDFFKRSMAIKKRLGNYPAYLISLYNVALINFELGDFKAARGQCQECLELNRLVGNIQLGAEVQGLLGEIELVEGSSVEAAQHLNSAIETCREIEAHTELTTMLRRMIPVQLALGDLPGAERSIDEGLKVAWRVNNRLEEALIQGYAADFHLASGEREKAVTDLAKAADLLSALDRHEELARLYSRMGLLHLDGGEEIRARECLQLATGIIERRKVSSLIGEWDTLQLRLQQRLGHFVERIESDGKLRLASFYQILAFMEDAGEGEESQEAVLRLLRESLGYRQALLLITESGAVVGRIGDEAGGSLESMLSERQDSLDLVERETGEPGARGLQIVVPLPGRGSSGGVLLLEREPGAMDGEERDFLTGLGRLLARALAPAHAPSGEGERREAGSSSSTSSPSEPRLIGKGRDMQRIRTFIARVRDAETTLLITGESGTGKEEVARAVHFGSIRRDKPFLAVNCASIPETLLESTLFGHERGAFTGASHRHVGIFEEAAGGTVFLDEIGEMGANMQAKLLRVLQSKEFTRVGGTRAQSSDVRILTATNRDLEAEVKHQRFREDLFYRINVLRLRLAPLREKREDIPLLVEFFLTQAGQGQMGGVKRLAPEVMEIFLGHPWPGNIRQLQNLISSCVVLSRGRVIREEDLPEDFLDLRGQVADYHSLEELAALVVDSGDYSEESPLEATLLATLASRLVEKVGSKAKAARLLGISKPTLYRRLRNYDTLQGSERGSV
jgi:DNA-binding NtrC family response regulator/tetratricopeptide (TPR) repeat protein